MAATNHHSDPMWYLQELIKRFGGRSIGETAEDIVLEIIGAGRGWHGKPTRRQVRQAATLLQIALQQSKENEVRILAARMLGELKSAQWTAVSLITALTDDDSGVRAGAALALGHLGNKRATQPLLHLLLSDESKARVRAAREADRSRWPAFNLVSQGQREQQVRLNAAEALGLLGDRRAVKPLITVLLKTKAKVVHAPTTRVVDDQDRWHLDFDFDEEGWEESEVRVKVAETLGELKDVRAVEPLCAALADEWGQVSTQAAWALRKLGDKRAVGPLISAFAYPNSELHRAVSAALLELCDKKAIDLLIAGLSSGSAGIRYGAADLLGDLKAVQAVEPLLVALADEDPWVREHIVSALGKIGDQRACDPLFQVFVREPLIPTKYEPDLRLAALLALAKLHDGRALEPLVALLTSEDTVVRWKTAEALADLGDPGAVEPLLAALHVEQTFVRNYFVRALSTFGDRRAVEPLIGLLTTPLTHSNSEANDVRRYAIDALTKLGDLRAVEPLIAIFQQESARFASSKELFAFNAEHAAQAVGDLGDRRAVEPLIAYLKDHRHIRWDIGSYVIEALGKIGDPAAMPALKWALRYDGDKILELKPPTRSKYRIYEVKAKATEAIARIMDANN
jgi:HEAT repeat protein